MRRIKLTKGYYAIVDDEDYQFLMQWQWHVLIGPQNVYAMRNSDPKNGRRYHILMHRVICKTPNGMDTDHVNGNSLDNRRCNLRVVTRSQNMWNRKPNKKGTSSFKGVYWHKQHSKWCAAIQINGKRMHIGLFGSEKDAAIAYEKRAKIEFKEFFRSHIV